VGKLSDSTLDKLFYTGVKLFSASRKHDTTKALNKKNVLVDYYETGSYRRAWGRPSAANLKKTIGKAQRSVMLPTLQGLMQKQPVAVMEAATTQRGLKELVSGYYEGRSRDHSMGYGLPLNTSVARSLLKQKSSKKKSTASLQKGKRGGLFKKSKTGKKVYKKK